MENLWTGLNSLISGEYMLLTHTSLWMFLIYGLVVFCEPVFKLLQKKPLILRGCVYCILIFSTEYLTGRFLRIFGVCPWSYYVFSGSINGLVMPAYAPLWFCAGLFYEKLYFLLKHKAI